MSDHVCVVCEHGPHRKAPCTVCGCNNWQNAAVASARALINTNNLLMQSIPATQTFLMDILELLVELHPEAVARIDARREEARLKNEAEKASQQLGPETDQTGQDANPSTSDGPTNIEGAEI